MAVSKAQRQAHGKRAAIYARVSDKSQDGEEKTSISEQINDMEAHCEDKGMTVTARYQEVGRGWSKKRPEFQRMLADAKRGRFDTIVCWKSDRLSRGMYPAAALMEVVEAYHINLEAVTDSIDMKTFGLMAAIGKIELDNFRERASMGKRGTAKQGRIPVGNIPYGYRIGDDGRPQIVEAEAEVVRRVYRMCVNDGLGAYLIARQLNLEGVPLAKLGKRWYDGTVHRILSNETYKGTWWYGKARYVSTEDGVRVYEQPQDDWIRVPFPPLVDKETWGRARVLRRQRFTRAKRNTKVFYLLQHLVRCTECGLLMGGSANTKKEVKRNGKLYKYELDPPRRYYRCYGYQQLRLKCRQKPMIRAERLEGLVWGEVKRVLENPDLIVAGIEALDNREDGGLEEQIATTERDLQKVQMEEERVIRLFVSGKITEDQLDHQRRYITERLETLRARLDDYRDRETLDVEKRGIMENLVKWAGEFGEGLDNLPDQLLRGSARAIPKARDRLLKGLFFTVSQDDVLMMCPLEAVQVSSLLSSVPLDLDHAVLVPLRAVKVGHPTRTKTGGSSHCCILASTNPNGRVWLLQRRGIQSHIVDVVITPFEGDILLRPELYEQSKDLIPAPSPLVNRDAGSPELVDLLASNANRTNVPAVRGEVEISY